MEFTYGVMEEFTEVINYINIQNKTFIKNLKIIIKLNTEKKIYKYSFFLFIIINNTIF
jgi:hypothetical protein